MSHQQILKTPEELESRRADVSQPKKHFQNFTPTQQQQQQQWCQPPCDWTGKDKTRFLQISAIPQKTNS